MTTSSWFYDSFNDVSVDKNLKASIKPIKVNKFFLSAESGSPFTQCFESSFSSQNSLTIGKGCRKSISTQLRKKNVEQFKSFPSSLNLDYSCSTVISSSFSSNSNFNSLLSNSKSLSRKRKANAFLHDCDKPSISAQVEPIEEDDLAVHAKKLEELKQWIRTRMSVERGGKTLLLTGPCGSAKTTSVKVLCAELGVEVMEFDGNGQEYELNFNGDEVFEKSAIRIFVQFMRNSQLTSIEKMSLKHRLLLVEQLPNIFYRNPELLHNTLREFVHTSRCTIVLIMSSIESCWELSPLRLFPNYILDELAIDHIKFNAVSITIMTKAIKRVFSFLNMRFTGNNAAVIKEIATSADGDIRKAMNLIEFFITGKSLTTAKQLNLSNTSNGHVELFHFIGKLMYAKRAESANQHWLMCEKILLIKSQRKYGRPLPPKDDINYLLNSCFISGDFFSGYIFEHEPMFAPSISSLAAVLSNLCACDSMFSTNYEGNQLIDKYVLEIAGRSAVYHNYNSNPASKPLASRRGLYQFDKPKLKDVKEKQKELMRMSIDLFSSTFLRTADIMTLVLPTFSMLNLYTNKAQLNLLNKLRLPNKSSLQTLAVRLVSQVVMPKPAVSTAKSSQLHLLNSEDCDEFEYAIEEII